MEQELPEELRDGFKLEVDSYFENIPLEEFLRAYVPTESDRYLKKLVDRGLIKVNGQTRSLNFKVRAGDLVEIGKPEQKPSEPEYPPPETIWSSDRMAVVQKYPGQKIGTQTKGTVPENQKLPDSFLEQFPLVSTETVYPVFSVPIYASGLILLTSDKETQEHLQDQLGTDECRLTADAVVDGRMKQNRRIEESIARSSHDAGLREVVEEGTEAVTSIEIEEKFRKFSHIRLIPETAVDHQCRVHLNYIHHPLTVDPEYGYRTELKLSEFKENYRKKPFQEERPLIQRISLHWSEAQFLPPGEEEKVQLKAELPDDMEVTLKQLSRHGS